MEKIRLKPTFVNTGNARNFAALMDGLALAAGEGCLGLVYGRAGRGKTRTAQKWYAENHSYYLRMNTVWRNSELPFLKALCKELGIMQPPKNKADCFSACVDQLIDNPVPVFLDEIEKLPSYFLDIIRDLSDISAAPFVLIGEEELVDFMRRNRRVWSRTYQNLEFKSLSKADVIVYARQSAGLNLDPQVADVLFHSCAGDFRLLKRDMLNLISFANSIPTREITVKIANTAINVGLKGRKK